MLYIDTLHAVGSNCPAEAATDGLVESCRPLHIIEPKPFLEDGEQFSGLLLRKAGAVTQTSDLLLNVLIIDILVCYKVAVVFEQRSGLNRQKFQFSHQSVGTFLNAGEQIDQLRIQIVVDVQSVWIWGQS